MLSWSTVYISVSSSILIPFNFMEFMHRVRNVAILFGEKSYSRLVHQELSTPEATVNYDDVSKTEAKECKTSTNKNAFQ